jgi:hypothetical protein
MIFRIDVRQLRILYDAQHQIRQYARILHNIRPLPVVALRICRNVAHVELNGGDAAVEFVVQTGFDEAAGNKQCLTNFLY